MNSAEGEGVDTLVSDIAKVTGLGGELFVMQMNFDRSSFAASAIPEPGTWVMMLISLSAVVCTLKFRRK